MKTLEVYRSKDALSWLPIQVAINGGGYGSVNTNKPAVLRTKSSKYDFRVKFLGMKKRVVLDEQDVVESAFEVCFGEENTTAFGGLLGILVAVFLLISGWQGGDINVGMMLFGLILLPLTLTFLLGRLTILPIVWEES